MVDDDRHALERRCFFFPFHDRLPPALEKVLRPRLVIGRVLAVELRHALRQRRRDFLDVVRTQVNVRIAAGMDVALRAVH